MTAWVVRLGVVVWRWSVALVRSLRRAVWAGGESARVADWGCAFVCCRGCGGMHLTDAERAELHHFVKTLFKEQ